jgi:hypothetical protein
MAVGMAVYFALTYLIGTLPIRAFLDPFLKKGAAE